MKLLPFSYNYVNCWQIASTETKPYNELYLDVELLSRELTVWLRCKRTES